MYAYSFLVSSRRWIGLLPTTSASAESGCTGRMKAAFGCRLLAAAFFAMSSPCEGRFVTGRHGPFGCPIVNNSRVKYQRKDTDPYCLRPSRFRVGTSVTAFLTHSASVFHS